MKPDFSPAMLALFLRAREADATHGMTGRQRAMAARRLRDWWRQTAGVTVQQLDAARHGRLRRAEPRVRLWAVLGFFPSEKDASQ